MKLNPLSIFAFFLLTNMFSIHISKAETPELAYRAEATTGEGSIWHPDRKSVFWVDIEGKTLYEFLHDTKTSSKWTFDRMVTTVVPETANSVIVALQDEIIRLDLTDGSIMPVVKIDDGGGSLRCNDGKCDPAGRLWIGTMALTAPRQSAALYMLHSNGRIDKKIDSVTISNGIVWSADEKYMYYNDTPTGRIARYKYDVVSGDITYDGVAVTLERGTGGADGMTIDSEGNLWVAQWGGYGVYCYSPVTGELIRKIDVPAPNVASCAFGGENLDILYITTARAGLSEEKLEEYPLSGSLFCCKPGVKGIQPNYFKNKE